MPIIISNLRLDQCKVKVDIGDTANQGDSATLKLYVGESIQEERSVELYYPPNTETFEVPRDGLNYHVKAVLTSSDESKDTDRLLSFCTE